VFRSETVQDVKTKIALTWRKKPLHIEASRPEVLEHIVNAIVKIGASTRP
jgi:hypothetical protein